MSFNIVEWLVVAMISRRTCSVPKEDVVFPRLLYCDSRCSQTCSRCSQVCHRRSQVLPGLSSALPGLSLALPVTLKAGRNALLRSDTLLKLTHLSLHSTSSQTLLKASSDKNTFCWWILPLYYSTIWTSTFATVSTDIPSYEAIHGRMTVQCQYCNSSKWASTEYQQSINRTSTER